MSRHAPPSHVSRAYTTELQLTNFHPIDSGKLAKLLMLDLARYQANKNNMAQDDDDDDEWKARAMQTAVENYASPQKEAHRCIVCLDEEVKDPCEPRPCRCRLGCWECIQRVMFTLGRCCICRQRICSLIRDSNKEIVFNYGDNRADEDSGDDGNDRFPRDDRNVIANHLHPSLHATYYPRGTPLADTGENPNGPGSPDALDRQVERRRSVYFHHRFSKHVGSNRLSRYREITPQAFRNDSALISRARMWIRRELLVFSFLRLDHGPDNRMDQLGRPRVNRIRRRAQNAEWLLEFIIAILKTVDLMGCAGQAENMLVEYLGRRNTQVFLHELRAWLRSPYAKLEDWDRVVQYDGELQPERLGPRDGEQEQAREGRASDGHPSQDLDVMEANMRQRRNRQRVVSDRYRDRYTRKRPFHCFAQNSRGTTNGRDGPQQVTFGNARRRR